MQKEIDIQVTPEQAATPALLLILASSHLSIPKADINHIEILNQKEYTKDLSSQMVSD